MEINYSIPPYENCVALIIIVSQNELCMHRYSPFQEVELNSLKLNVPGPDNLLPPGHHHHTGGWGRFIYSSLPKNRVGKGKKNKQYSGKICEKLS